ncbi:hypothetical protein ACH47X_25340, partial [Promicromonospora kroppenstedtii]
HPGSSTTTLNASTPATDAHPQPECHQPDGSVQLDGVATAERRAYHKRLVDGHGYDDGHRTLLLGLQAEQARRVNRAGGYWIAGAEPGAAQHGITTTEERATVSALLLASDGVDPIRHPDAIAWRDLHDEANARCPEVVLRRIHEAEDEDPDGRRWPRSKPHDDKTMVTIALESSPSSC